MKTCMPRRPRDETSVPKDLRAEDRVEKILEEKALKMKVCAPSEANEPCHKVYKEAEAQKEKTSRRTRHSEVDASGVRTCID